MTISRIVCAVLISRDLTTSKGTGSLGGRIRTIDNVMTTNINPIQMRALFWAVFQGFIDSLTLVRLAEYSQVPEQPEGT